MSFWKYYRLKHPNKKRPFPNSFSSQEMAFSLLRSAWICNPAVLNISICNAKWPYVGFKILILTVVGLQIRPSCQLRKYKAKSTPSGFQGTEGVNTILGKDRYWSARSILLHLRRLDTCGHLGYYSARSLCCSSTMRVSAIMAKKFVKCL